MSNLESKILQLERICREKNLDYELRYDPQKIPQYDIDINTDSSYLCSVTGKTRFEALTKAIEELRK